MAIALFSHFDRMVQAMGRPDLLKDERLGTLLARYKKENFDYFLTIVREWAKDRTIEEASKLFEKYDVAFGKVNSVADVVRSPVVRERKMLTEVDLSKDVRALVVNTPFRFSQSACGPQGRPPYLGEHNREVFKGLLKISEEEMGALTREGILFEKERS